jgi:hypothetical protein
LALYWQDFFLTSSAENYFSTNFSYGMIFHY